MFFHLFRFHALPKFLTVSVDIRGSWSQMPGPSAWDSHRGSNLDQAPHWWSKAHLERKSQHPDSRHPHGVPVRRDVPVWTQNLLELPRSEARWLALTLSGEDQESFKHHPPRIAPLSLFSSQPRVSPAPCQDRDCQHHGTPSSDLFMEKTKTLNSESKFKKKFFFKFLFYIWIDPKPVIHQNALITWGFLKNTSSRAPTQENLTPWSWGQTQQLVILMLLQMILMISNIWEPES